MCGVLSRIFNVAEKAILGELHLEEQLAEFHAQRQRELEVSPPICGEKSIPIAFDQSTTNP